MQLTYKISVSPQKKNNCYEVQIDGYRYLEELWKELESKGIIDRLKDIPQLGCIFVPKVLKKTRYDYVMLQMYLHQFIRMNLNEKLKFTYNNYLSKDDLNIKSNITINQYKPSIGDAMQVFALIYNIGHFYNTFTASRAVVLSSKENLELRESIFREFDEGEELELAQSILAEDNYYRYHLLNSLLILHQCDQSKSPIKFAYALLKQYLKPEQCNSKMQYVFSVFRDIRTFSYFVYDLPISKTPLYLEIRDKEALKTILIELLDQYNDHQPIHSLLSAITKILDDTIYNENSQGIILYQISKKIEQSISKIDWKNVDYYTQFMDEKSAFNIKYPQNRRFDKNNILKITIKENERIDTIKLFKDLSKINFVKTGFYDRNLNRARTLLISLGNNCRRQESKVWCSFRVMKEIVGAMQKEPQIYDNDLRYIAVVKFFLYYLLGEYPIKILPTIDDTICIFVKRGKSARVKCIDKLLGNNCGKEDARHEIEFIRNYLLRDTKNDTAIILSGSLLVFDKEQTGKKLSEYDGLIIYPFRKSEQVVFVEAKNKKDKPGFAKKCLKEKLNIAQIQYNEADIVTIDYDCYLKYSIKK